MFMPSIFGDYFFEGFFDDPYYSAYRRQPMQNVHPSHHAYPAHPACHAHPDHSSNHSKCGHPMHPVHAAHAVMKTDVIESADSYELHIDLPGYKKEDVKAELNNGYLKVTASFTDEKEEDDKKYLRRERYFGSCSRSFYVGENVEKDEIKARFNEGVLELSVPKKEAKQEKEEKNYIAIE